MDNMIVSVIIPVFNAEKYIKKCLDSILAQSFSAFEVVVLDDGSTDKTGTICDAYAQRDSRVKVFHEENHGTIMARCLAIEKCSGEFITFVDADDLIEPEMIQTMYELILENEADIVCCGNQTLSKHGYITRDPQQRNHSGITICNGRDIAGNFCGKGGVGFTIWSKLYKKDLLKSKVDDFRALPHIFWGEDSMINAMVFLNAGKVVYTEKPFYKYRVGGESRSYSEKTLKDLSQIYSWRKQFLQMHYPNDKSLLRGNIEQVLNASLFYASTSKGKMTRQMTLDALKEAIDDMKMICPDFWRNSFFDVEKKMTDAEFYHYYKPKMTVKIKQLLLRIL